MEILAIMVTITVHPRVRKSVSAIAQMPAPQSCKTIDQKQIQPNSREHGLTSRRSIGPTCMLMRRYSCFSFAKLMLCFLNGRPRSRGVVPAIYRPAVLTQRHAWRTNVRKEGAPLTTRRNVSRIVESQRAVPEPWMTRCRLVSLLRPSAVRHSLQSIVASLNTSRQICWLAY